MSVVVDDDDVVDDAERLERLHARADARGLVVGRQHDRDGSSVPHPSQILPGQPASAVAFGT